MQKLILDWLVARLSEKSTYAGLGALLAAAGLQISGANVEGLTAIALAVGNFAAMIIKEKTA